MTVRHPGRGQCTVCKHREHAMIDLALARGVAVRALAKRFDISIDSIYRHQKAHLPPQLRAQLISAAPDLGGLDLDKLRESEGQSLLSHLVAIRGRLFGALDVAEECGDSPMVARIIARVHDNLRLTGELLGTLGIGPTTVNNNLILASDSYIKMRVEMLRALKPYPEAARAVAQVLHKIEHAAAQINPPVEINPRVIEADLVENSAPVTLEDTKDDAA